MNLHNLEAFVYAVHFGSFNKAAEALFLTQPSVTARIHTLETQMNTKLFYREGKSITLTEKGKEFLPYAQNILLSFQEAKSRMEQPAMEHQTVRIGCATSIATCLVPEFFPKFIREFPKVHIQMKTGHSKDILNKLLNKEVDFAIIRSIAHPEIECHLLKEDPIVPVVSSGHPLSGRTVTIREAARYPIIYFGYDSMDLLVIKKLFQSEFVEPMIAMEVDSMEAAKAFVKNGVGISFLPKHCVKKELESGELSAISLRPGFHWNMKISLVHLKGANISPFLDFFDSLSFAK
ncbi:LysR family transcriptional regulator [Bacillus massilinigeriensis]|uniref:LysR family transcriptional regulator n=1 Tax=Bacillus mediterraneensis TaxID=1805474 RepID=UPI0008F8CAEA|nr:LysR family transcriptional regulator [Bacillus mediterraneensis]